MVERRTDTRRPRVRTRALVAVTVAWALVGAGAHPATAAAAPGTGPQSAGGRHDTAVTLVTGDRVHLVAGRVVGVSPGEDRTGMTFQSRAVEGRTVVIPGDALGLVAEGRVDERLFDVTALASAQEDVPGRAEVPLVIEHDDRATARDDVRWATRTADVEVTAELDSVSATAAAADHAGATRLWDVLIEDGDLAEGVEAVWLDGTVRASTDGSVPQIGAPSAWAAGVRGAGVTVAVLDSGIDITHPDLDNAVVESANFSFSDTQEDLLGHGTHVASVITGSGAASDGRYQGVAPDASLVSAKVLDDTGWGTESQVIAGMEWAVAQGADIVNMSLANDAASDGTDPLSQAVDALTEATGTLFVASAGNSGGTGRGVAAPAAASTALAVGAVDAAGDVAAFSGHGPRPGDGAVKPEITAPGVDVTAARAKSCSGGDDAGPGCAPAADPVGDSYLTLTGTSTAAPHVAGAAALVKGAHPDWEAGLLKAALVNTAVPSPGAGVYRQGSGQVNVSTALSATTVATPAALLLGTAAWPHDDDIPLTRTLTYTNVSAEPVTLTLAAEMSSVDGQALPAGRLTLSADTVAIPAGGAGTVDVTVDTAGLPEVPHAGLVTAVDDRGAAVRTPVSFQVEPELYDVSVSFVDDAGQATTGYVWLFLLDSVTGQAQFVSSETGADGLTARVPVGIYAVDTGMQRDESTDRVWHIEPWLVVDDDLDFTVDARRASSLRPQVDRPAELSSGFLSVDVEGREAVTHYFGRETRVDPTWLPQPDQVSVEYGAFLWPGPVGSGSAPYDYALGWEESGAISNLSPVFRDEDLVEVKHRFASQVPGESATFGERRLTLPGTHTTFASEGFTAHVPALHVGTSADGSSVYYQQSTGLDTSGDRVERWNQAPYGPGVRLPDAAPYPWVGVAGSFLTADVPMFSDSAPGHVGNSTTDEVSYELFRERRSLGVRERTGDWELPSGDAEYRLQAQAARSVSPFATQVDAIWTFRAEPSEGSGSVLGFDLPDALPVMAVRFAPRLDEFNRARAGVRAALPFTVERQPGPEYGRLRVATVEASFDDGRTWRRLPVAGHGDTRVATVKHPGQPGFVSLRAIAADSRGNAVEQTIIRAYAIR